MSAQKLIDELQLAAHPEGGYYRETYRSPETIMTNEGRRNLSTAIYYLLENEQKSLFHRIKSDELWFFHQGATLEIVLIRDNSIQTILLGNNIEKGETLQAVIPADTWFAAMIKNLSGYALVSCTVAPGFNFLDFELAKKEDLLEQFPQLKDHIEIFTLQVKI